MKELLYRPIEDFLPNPANIRVVSNPEEDAELLGSLLSIGQQVPLIVGQEVDEKWPIIEGHRRWRLAPQAGITHLYAVQNDRPMSELDLIEVMLSANEVRASVKLEDRAVALLTLMSGRGWNQKQLSEHTGLSPATICRTLKVFKGLSEEMRKRIGFEGFSANQAYAAVATPRQPRTSKLTAKVNGSLTVAFTAKEALTAEGLEASLVELLKAVRKAKTDGTPLEKLFGNGKK